MQFVQKLKSDYIASKYYGGLYVHMGSNGVVSTIISFLAGPFLYYVGVLLPNIFWFYCLIQVVYVVGLLRSPFLVNKLGYTKTVVMSYLFFGLFLVSVFLASQSLVFVFLASFFQGLQKSFYYPIMDTLQANFIENKNRGKQISVQYILVSLASAFAAFVAGWLLSYHMNFILLVIALFFTICALLPLYVIFKGHMETSVKTSRDIFSFLKAKIFRKRLFQTVGLTTTMTILTTILSLYIFIYFKDFKIFGSIMAVAALFEIIIGIYFGRLIDTSGRRKGLKLSSIFVGLGNILLIIFNATAWAVSALKVYVQGVFNFLLNSYDANYNDKAKESGQPYLFSLSVLIIMAMSGAVLFAFCAILSYFLSVQILFICMFVVSLVGLYANLIFFKE